MFHTQYGIVTITLAPDFLLISMLSLSIYWCIEYCEHFFPSQYRSFYSVPSKPRWVYKQEILAILGGDFCFAPKGRRRVF